MALVRKVPLAVVHVVDVVAVLLRLVAAIRSVLVPVVIHRFGVADDVVDDTFVALILGGDVLERLGLLPHLRRHLRTHHVLLPAVNATEVPWWGASQTGRPHRRSASPPDVYGPLPMGKDAPMVARAAGGPRVTKRYWSDAWVAAIALGIAALASVFRASTLSDAERDVFESINHLSNVWSGPIQAVMLFGVFAAIPVAALIAMVFRRFRLASVVLASGCVAYALAKLGKPLVDAGRPLAVLPNSDVIVRGAIAQGLGYPSGHSAVSAALAFAALPYLNGRYRWLILLLPLIVGFGRIYVGAHLPLDVVGGWAIGVGSAFIVHLIAGRPPLTRPADPAQVEAELDPLPASS